VKRVSVKGAVSWGGGAPTCAREPPPPPRLVAPDGVPAGLAVHSAHAMERRAARRRASTDSQTARWLARQRATGAAAPQVLTQGPPRGGASRAVRTGAAARWGDRPRHAWLQCGGTGVAPDTSSSVSFDSRGAGEWSSAAAVSRRPRPSRPCCLTGHRSAGAGAPRPPPRNDLIHPRPHRTVGRVRVRRARAGTPLPARPAARSTQAGVWSSLARCREEWCRSDVAAGADPNVPAPPSPPSSAAT